MQPPTSEFFQWNVDKMQQHAGGEFSCRQCGGLGIVGKDLQAATSDNYESGCIGLVDT